MVSSVTQIVKPFPEPNSIIQNRAPLHYGVPIVLATPERNVALHAGRNP
jgi:hypothetical protein